MPFQVSPGVNVSEIDLTTVVPAVSTTEGALAGVFRWGPVGQRVLIDSEAYLAARFGKPTNHNAETFFTGANFLSYGNKLYISRAADTTSVNTSVVVRNAVANTGAISDFDNSNTGVAAYIVKNGDHYDTLSFSDQDVKYIAKYPGAMGNSLKVSVCDSNAAYQSTANLDNGGGNINTLASAVTVNVGSANVTLSVGIGNGTISNVTTLASSLISGITVGDYIQVGNSSIGLQYMKVSATPTYTNTATTATITVPTADTYGLSTNYSVTGNSTVAATFTRKWEFWNAVDAAPGISKYQQNFGNSAATDELHVVVTDEDGLFTGTPGTILEVMAHMSRAIDAKSEDGATNYYKTVINDGSNYIWWANDRSGAASVNTAISLVNPTTTAPLTISFANGTDGQDETAQALTNTLTAYDLFTSAEDVDVSLILTGRASGGTNGEQKANYLIDNIAERRKDCVVFCSPEKADVVNAAGNEATNAITFRNSLRSTSYAVMDSGYKYQYDKYNDIYRWIPLNGDTAGLCVRTDDTRDPWWSPAGFNRGQVKNIVKLAYNPRQADRDQLYKANINPVVTFPGQGTVLYGDKTLLAKPSAFDRINVRRLFIVLEKAIATATKFTLFEFNDDFTRAQFRNLVEPFLRDVQGRRGIYDFKVVCDTTNNTGEVIDGNRFVGDIYIKPAKSINFIQLNFVAVRTGVEFSEVVGKF